MMKKTILLLFAAFYLINSFAQEPVFTWGESHSKPGTEAAVQLFGHTADGYYIVNKQEPSEAQQRSIIRSAFSPVVTVEYINNTGVRIFNKDVSTGRSDDYVNVIYFDNAVYMISALFNKDAGKNVLTAKAINSDGSDSKPVEIGSMPSAKMSQRGLFYVSASPDGSKLLILSQPDYVKDQNEKISLTLFGKGFTKTWSTEQTFPYPWSKSVDNRPYINNDGTAFILKQISIKGSDDSWSAFSCAGAVLKEFKLALADKKISSVVQAFSPEGDFTVAGYYKEEGGKIRVSMGDKAHGSFLYRIDAAGQSLKVGVLNAFDKRTDIIARNIVFNDKTTILLGEIYTVAERSATRNPSAPQTNESMFARDYSYGAGDILIDGFDDKGKPLYSTNVHKNNMSKNDLGYWISYLAAVVKGKLRLVFMDNYSRYDNKAISINTPNIIVYTTVDPLTGAAEKPQPVSKPGPVGGKGIDSYLMPDVFLKIDESRYLIRAENSKDYRIGEVAF